jgi:uncharacterized protein
MMTNQVRWKLRLFIALLFSLVAQFSCQISWSCEMPEGFQWKKVLLSAVLAVTPVSALASSTTLTGIPLDQNWKQQLYAFAQKNVVHPSWGLSHSERDYQNTLVLAQIEGVDVDRDVLFACAFLHDLGGIGSFAKAGVDHAVRSAELVGPLLSQFGFPQDKVPAVKEMILGHTYYGPVPRSRQAFLFRDADILDFLGAIGVARLLAVTEEPGRSATLPDMVGTLKDFAQSMPSKLSSHAAQTLAPNRIAEMNQFFSQLDAYTFDDHAL